jgi:uncharacterized membrane protein
MHHGHVIPADPHVHRVEMILSVLLRAGVVVSLFVVVLGTTLSFVHHSAYRSAPPELTRLTGPDAVFPHTLAAVWEGVLAGQGQAIVVAGLLLLIATPVLRVAVSILAFALQRDWIFVVITSLVLALLLLSFFLGKVEG